MKLMMLGASGSQIQGIKKAKELGCSVVTCDYLPEAIGHQVSDDACLASTFDIEGVLAAAKALDIEGIMTMGTDQPVYTGAVVASKLGLPQMLDVDVALSVTHKKVMKETFLKHQLPTVPYVIFGRSDDIDLLNTLAFPVVIKPVDSQGQRGIFYCQSPQEVLDHFDEVVGYSREAYILVETYYKHEEVTVSGWVEAGITYILAITDRVTFDATDRLGICLAHTFPSKHTKTYGGTIIDLSQRIVEAFGIKKGPIYFQMLIGDEGIKINEIACRIGGAYEGNYIPLVTGFDLCEAMVKETMGQGAETQPLKAYTFPPENKFLSVQLFFSEPCSLVKQAKKETIMALEGVIDCGFNYRQGDVIEPIKNATARAGFVIVEGGSAQALEARLDRVFQVLQMIGDDGQNHLIRSKAPLYGPAQPL